MISQPWRRKISANCSQFPQPNVFVDFFDFPQTVNT